ncbi:glycosyltransferase [Desulfococcaceae bacterium HSG9]|nr:glycosyltransferase [Desulfococcaceae bacterium HSG9]
MNKLKAVIINPWYTPYRIPVLREVSQHEELDVTIIYCRPIEVGREWTVPGKLPVKAIYLKPLTLLRYQDRRIFGEEKSFQYPAGLFKMLRQIKPDVIVALEFRIDCLTALFYSIISGCDYVTWSDMTHIHDVRMGIVRMLIRRLLLWRSKALIGSSTDTLTHFQQSFDFSPQKSFLSILGSHAEELVSTSGVKAKCPEEIREKQNISFLYIGRLVPLKGVELLLNAFAKFHLKFPHTRLTLLGDGPERQSLLAMVEKFGLKDHVTFQGYVPFDQIPHEIIQHDVLVLPTKIDVFGLVIAEAIICGVPVICSCYAGAANDLVKENGIVVTPENTAEFVNALNCMMSPDKRRRMTAACNKMTPIINLNTATKTFVAALQAASCK